MPFPADFIWGVSTASYQIEGASREDGKGLSVWDVFCRKESAVRDGHTGDVACDHYHRYREDIALLKDLGVDAYRLSLSWPRILPEGRGATSPAGVDFYNRVLDELLEAGIHPWVTLFHWDYPYELYRRGGWLNPDSPDWFAEYASTVIDLYSDRVDHWMTLNEPQVFIGHGHQDGVHAPGLQLSLAEVIQCGHHALLAHGKSVSAIRARAKSAARVGFAPAGQIPIPAEDTPADIEAARKAMFSVRECNCWNNTWWMDPVFLGRYPADGLALLGEHSPVVGPDDMHIISAPVDFCGVNVYYGTPHATGPDGEPVRVLPPAGHDRTSQSDWPVTPTALYYAPKWLYEQYGKPVVITENGHQNLDGVAMDGKVHDPQRIDYLHRYLLQLERAIADGAEVGGYFQWTFMDNFEWALGYYVRVGLVYTDFQTLQRIPKDSYRWYRDVIASNGAALHRP